MHEQPPDGQLRITVVVVEADLGGVYRYSMYYDEFDAWEGTLEIYVALQGIRQCYTLLKPVFQPEGDRWDAALFTVPGALETIERGAGIRLRFPSGD